MRIVLATAALLLAATLPASAAELGSFDDARLLLPLFNLVDGTELDIQRAVLAAQGVNVTLTEQITPQFLDTVDVFYVSVIVADLPTAEEVQALAEWVAGGGVLIVTADCTWEGQQPAYNAWLAPFGIEASGRYDAGVGQVLAVHHITRYTNSPYFVVNGLLTFGADAKALLADPFGQPACVVLERITGYTGLGKVVVTGDWNMFTDDNITLEDNLPLFENIVAWAIALPCPGDLNGDGTRDFTDFTAFSPAWLSQLGDPNYNPASDLNASGTVDFTDFTQFASVYGQGCP